MRERLRRHRLLTLGAGALAAGLLAACTPARPAPPPPPPPPPGVSTGLGFDTCSAPSTSSMATWLAASSYRSIGIYIGGLTRGRSEPNLDTAWVSTVANSGWRLAPLYVGLQAPCNGSLFGSGQLLSGDPNTVYGQGVGDAADAVGDAKRWVSGQGRRSTSTWRPTTTAPPAARRP